MGFLKEIVLKAKLKSDADKGKRFMSWDQIKTIALIVDSKMATNKSELDKFIYETDRVVDVYYLDLQLKESPIKNFITFGKKEKNVLGLPNSKARTKIQNKKYDLLINASFDELDYSSVLGSMIKTTCRSGFESRVNELDLIIKRGSIQSLVVYLEEVVSYLKMIRN